MANAQQFEAVFTQLKALLQPFEAQLVVETDAPGNYMLYTAQVEPSQKPVMFGGVQIKKNYVSYHLLPVYMFPALLDHMSPALGKRMQGKSCFNFTKPDPALFDELAQLTARGFGMLAQMYPGHPVRSDSVS